jgi:threonine dehydrogenase-like Zn-dependent dehydrogenase
VPLEGALAAAPAGPEAALLAREAPLVYELLARAGVAAGEATIWLGDPVLSALGARIAEAKGARGIVVGADRHDAAGPALLAERLEATRGAGEAEPTDVRIFETSGDPAARRAALALAPDGATVGFLAVPERAGDRLGDALARELTLFSIGAPHADLVPEVVALAVRGELALAGLVEESDAVPDRPTRIWVRRTG